MTSTHDPQQYIHRAAVDPEGSRVGKVSQVYVEDQTGQPTWLLVDVGMFGTRPSFVPFDGSRLDGDVVVLPASKDQIKDAPSIDKDGQLSESEQESLRQHYSGVLGTGQGSGLEHRGQAREWDSGPATRPNAEG